MGKSSSFSQCGIRTRAMIRKACLRKSVRMLHKDEKVRDGRFGGEGTGGQAFFDYDWRTNETYRFYVTARTNAQRTEYGVIFCSRGKIVETSCYLFHCNGGQADGQLLFLHRGFQAQQNFHYPAPPGRVRKRLGPIHRRRMSRFEPSQILRGSQSSNEHRCWHGGNIVLPGDRWQHHKRHEPVKFHDHGRTPCREAETAARPAFALRTSPSLQRARQCFRNRKNFCRSSNANGPTKDAFPPTPAISAMVVQFFR